MQAFGAEVNDRVVNDNIQDREPSPKSDNSDYVVFFMATGRGEGLILEILHNP